MATCGHLDFIATPPTLEFMLENFSRIPPNDSIDRSTPRCRLCDLIATQAREEEAFSIENSRAVWKAEKDIRTTEIAINRGISIVKEEPETTLSQLKRELKVALEVRDQKIANAWYQHWGIWGPTEGPEPVNEISWEDDSSIHDTGDIKPKTLQSRVPLDQISWDDDGVTVDGPAPCKKDDVLPTKAVPTKARGRKRA